MLDGCSGASFDSLTGGGGSKKDSPPTAEPASDPMVVTGAYLTCEQTAPSAGSGEWSTRTSDLGCNAMTSQGIVNPNGKALTMTAIFEVNGQTQEKSLDFSKDKHVSIQIANRDILSLKFSLKDFPESSVSIPAAQAASSSTPGSLPGLIMNKLNLVCGEPGNSCYDNELVKFLGVAKLAYWDVPITYEKADPNCLNNCFKLWIRTSPINGIRVVLNARGTSSFQNTKFPWQHGLSADGIGLVPWIQYPDQTKSLAVRTCPRLTMLDNPESPVANSCLYYDKGVSDKTNGLNPDLKEWSSPSWFVGNHSNCSSKGMRLPTLYETDIKFDSGFVFDSKYFPATSLIVTQHIFSNARNIGIPPVSSLPDGSLLGTWTATSNSNKDNRDEYFVWGHLSPWTNQQLDNSNFSDKFFNSSTVAKWIRCVLPSSH